LLIWVVGLLLLNLVLSTYIEIRQLLKNSIVPYLLYFRLGILEVLFGSLIEWKRISRIFNGDIEVNWLLAPGLLLLIAGLIPDVVYTPLARFSSSPLTLLRWLINPLGHTATRTSLHVLTGIILVRSITRIERG